MKTHPHLFLFSAIMTALAGMGGPLPAADMAAKTCSPVETGPALWHATPLLDGSILESGATPAEPPGSSLDEGFANFPTLTLGAGSTSRGHRAGTGRWQNLQGVPFGLVGDDGRYDHPGRQDRPASGTAWHLEAERSLWGSGEERVAGASYAVSRRIEFSLTYKSLGVVDNAFGTDDWVDRSKTHSVLAIFKVKF